MLTVKTSRGASWLRLLASGCPPKPGDRFHCVSADSQKPGDVRKAREREINTEDARTMRTNIRLSSPASALTLSTISGSTPFEASRSAVRELGGEYSKTNRASRVAPRGSADSSPL